MSGVHCQYCDRPASISVEKDGVRVGLCATHLREQFDALQSSGWLDGLVERLALDERL